MSRRLLIRLVSIMFAILMLGFIGILLTGLGVGLNDNHSSSSEPFADILAGQTSLRRVDNQRVWLTRLTARQIEQATQVEPSLVNPKSGCGVELGLCVLSAAAANNGLDISYSLAAPPQLPSDRPWFGGFVDPTTGAVFDLLGRAYRLGKESDGQTLIALSLY